MMLVIALVGCAQRGITPDWRPDVTDVPLALDDAEAFGFSASEVLARVGLRTYDAAPLEGNDRSDELASHGPFTIAPMAGAAVAWDRLETWPDGTTTRWFWIQVPVAITSADGAFSAAGTFDLVATGLEDAEIAWMSWTYPYGAVGDMPAWATAHLDAHTLCGADADVSAEDGRLMLVLDDAVDAPEMRLLIGWSVHGECQGVGTIDRVALTADGGG